MTERDRRDAAARSLGVTSANWLEAPYNRLGFRSVETLARTARISRGDGPALELPRKEHDLAGLRFQHGGRTFDLPAMLANTFTDGFLVVQYGAVVTEQYFNGMEPHDTHLLMSISKSLNSTLCGVLVGDGALRTDDFASDHIPQLRGTSWEGCTVQHLLDMRVGARWDFDLDEHTILDVSDYRAHTRTDIPANTASWICAVPAAGDHGGPFAYNSLANDVLGWVLEGAGGMPYPELFSDRIWSKLGAEHDALIILDRSCFPVVEGGMCTTLRDLARFGLMCLQTGVMGAKQIVPANWIDRRLFRDEELIDAYGGQHNLGGPLGSAFYHDNWWIWDAERGIYAAVGMNGQSLFLHHPSRTVIAKLSTFPDALDTRLFALQHAGMAALAETLVQAASL